MDITFNTAPISQAARNQVNITGAQLFDQLTGQIKSGLETLGVDLKVPQAVVPKPGSESQAPSPEMDWKPYIIGGVALVILLKLVLKKGHSRV